VFESLPLPLLLVGQLLVYLPIALSLITEAVYHNIEEVLRQLGIKLLARDGAVVYCLA
jgi:hypothetical protein